MEGKKAGHKAPRRETERYSSQDRREESSVKVSSSKQPSYPVNKDREQQMCFNISSFVLAGATNTSVLDDANGSAGTIDAEAHATYSRSDRPTVQASVDS